MKKCSVILPLLLLIQSVSVSLFAQDSTRLIPRNTYWGREDITSFTVPEGVETIGGWAFAHCRNMKTIVFPESLKTIDDYAFYGCVALDTIVIPAGVNLIENNAFLGCEGLKSVVIPEGVSVIEFQTFRNCYNLTSVTIPKSVRKIGFGAFENCGKLESIVVPEGVTSIGNNCFGGCGNLKTIDIPASVTEIADNAFFDCISLKTVNMPDGELKEKVLAYLYKMQNEEKHGMSDGHEWVDLGLSVKWATCNVGAGSPESFGDYFDGAADAAHDEWGGGWRTPTMDEWQELIDNCEMSESIHGGVRGFKFASKTNNNSIFLPCGGFMRGQESVAIGMMGRYRTSAEYVSQQINMAFGISGSQVEGITVRAVTK